MRPGKFPVQPIASALEQAVPEAQFEEACRRKRLADATLRNCRKDYGGPGVSELRRRRHLEKENGRRIEPGRRMEGDAARRSGREHAAADHATEVQPVERPRRLSSR